MEQSVARRAFMEQQFDRLGYRHTRIKAYTPETSPIIRKPARCQRSSKDYACIASHLKTFHCLVGTKKESE